MRAFTEGIPGTIVLPGGQESGKLVTATWTPSNPDWVTLGFPDRVTEVSRDGWYAGTGAPHCEAGGRVYPSQWTDVHWTVFESRVPGLPVLRWFVQTWRVTGFVGDTHIEMPASWTKDLEDLNDDAKVDAWLRGLAGAA
jgi:hypothetical protein